MSSADDYLKSYNDESQSSYLYRILAEHEKKSPRAQLFLKLSAESAKQAEIWKAKLAPMGIVPGPVSPSLRVQIAVLLLRTLGPRAILPVLASLKIRGLSVFKMGEDHEDIDEKKLHRAVRTGGNLRAAVFGVNDGLISNLGLILGVAGATQDSKSLFTAGFAGLCAGAFSMAAGEYVSVRSQRELYEYQIALEKAEFEEFPEEEAEELALIYEAKGIPREDARRWAQNIISKPKQALDELAREELGLNPSDLGSPWGAAISSFMAFAVGATIPMIPFFISSSAILPSIIISGVSLFGVGGVLSLFTGRSMLWSALRMVLIGGMAGGVTYGLGSLLGVATSI